MPFMFLILAFLMTAVVWGFFHANPRGVSRLPLGICNFLIVATGVAVGAVAGWVLYGDAIARRPDEMALAIYVSIMAAGTAFMIVLASGGLARNLVLFPLSRRQNG